MANGIEKSFRIKEVGLRSLDELRDYFTDVNRSDICAAAIRLFAESGGTMKHGVKEEARPFDFCKEPVRSVLNDSYRAGRTTADIKIVFGESVIELSRNTMLKYSGLSGVTFHLTSQSAVTLDLACDYDARLTESDGTKQLTIDLMKEERTIQNRETGRIANRTGRYIASELAEALDVELISENSNEVEFNGGQYVIKTARTGNKLFGITKRMHDRLDGVLLAVETEQHVFDVYAIAMHALIAEGVTTGENSGRGRVISYYVDSAIGLGEKILTMEINLSAFDAEKDRM